MRRELQGLPGSPSQAAALAALEAQAATLRRRAAAMEARSVPRPQPPAYAAVQADVQRFVAGMAALPRMQSLLRRLQVGTACRLCLDLSMRVEAAWYGHACTACCTGRRWAGGATHVCESGPWLSCLSELTGLAHGVWQSLLHRLQVSQESPIVWVRA